MPSVGRNKVHSLHPLNARQIDFFSRLGELAAQTHNRRTQVWWMGYFETPSGKPLTSDAWEDPGYDISNKFRFLKSVEDLKRELDKARTNRSVQQALMKQGFFPPNVGKDPYAIPEYFTWWQSENAFRRGYVMAYETTFLHDFKELLKNRFRNDGNILTSGTMKHIALMYAEDPSISIYFKDMHDAVDKGQPWPFSSLRATYDDMLRKREKAYQQFDPHFQPLRWLPGAGLVGIEEG